MKNMKKLLQKAMVFTLTAAMLVGTPLTASAAGLVDLYQIEDGWGNVTGNEDNTRTGTVTATQTNSGILDANAQLEGIVLDETNVELEIPEEKPTRLTASLDWGTVDGTVPEAYKALNDDLLKRLQWKSSNTAIVALDTKSVEGKFKDGPRDVITLKPKAAGTATVTVSLDSAEHNIHYSAEATITVVQYADELKFNEKIKKYAVTGNSIALDEYVDTYVGGKLAKTSDTLAFALKDTNKPAIATLKNGVLTLKKTGSISILAIGKNCKSEWYPITVGEGNNAKTIVFKDSTGNVLAKNKFDWVVNTLGKSTTVSAEVTETKNNKKPCTDKISWSSKKPAIVDVATTSSMELDENDKCSVTLIAKSAGKGQIVAKASSGKSVTLNVTVSANLKNIKIENETMKFYSGQTVDLYDVADQYFGKDKNDTSAETGNKNFTDAGLKWVFVGDNNAQKPMKKLASINAKGVLTIKPDITTGITGDKVIKVQAVNAKKVGDDRPGTIKSNELTINLEQVNVTEIIVNKGTTPVANAKADNGSVKQYVKGAANADTVAAGGSRIYTLTAKGTIGDATETVTLDPAVLGWTASGNGKIVKASRNAVSNGVIRANNKGTATVTVNSATKKVKSGKPTYSPIKTTFKVKVTAPTKTLTLTVKNKGIAATGKKQTISITPVIQKGSTTNKTKDIIWKAYKEGDPTKTFDAAKGKLKLTEGGYAAGDVIVVRASVVNGGPQTSIRLTVVKESKNVEFQDASGAKVTKLNKIENDQTVTAKVNLKSGGTPVLPGVDNVSGVTYTVNKTGIVRIVENKDGTITIEPLNSGSVKITAKTLDGKTGNLNVTVK